MSILTQYVFSSPPASFFSVAGVTDSAGIAVAIARRDLLPHYLSDTYGFYNKDFYVMSYQNQESNTAGHHWIRDESRIAIYRRDGWKCLICGSRHDLTLDHITTRVSGGSNHPNNLYTSCRSCNSSRGSRVLIDWLTSGRRTNTQAFLMLGTIRRSTRKSISIEHARELLARYGSLKAVVRYCTA